MKQTLLLLSLIAIALFGCKKNEPVATPTPGYNHGKPYTGIVTAFKNGQPWIANAYAVMRHDDSGRATDRFLIFMDHFEKYGADSNLRDYLIVDYLKCQAYKTDLAGDSAFTQPPAGIESISHHNYLGGDVAEPPSSLVKTEPHWIEITNYDPATLQISGRFEATFESFDHRERLQFSNGFFTATIYK
jgi:hypothetical protein